MTGEAGAPGTAGRDYRVPEKAGRHRAPPPPPPTDRVTVPLAAAAAILTAASLLAIAGQAVAPDATAAASTTTAPTAVRTARTVHVPLEILPAPVPVIGAEGAWDPETDAQMPVENTLSRPVSVPRVPVHVPSPDTRAAAPSGVPQAVETTDSPPQITEPVTVETSAAPSLSVETDVPTPTDATPEPAPSDPTSTPPVDLPTPTETGAPNE